MRYAILDEILDGPFRITARPEPISGDLRRGWGITLLLLILHYSYGRRASLQKLHFLAFAARTEHNRALVQAVLDGLSREEELLVRIEPWVNRALAFADAAGLLHLVKGKTVRTSAKGVLALATIMGDEELLAEERLFLSRCAKLATEDVVTRILKAKPTA
jgi:hypothetical protein